MPMQITTYVIVTMLQAFILISLWAILYQVVKQQGRLLLRLDEIDRRLAHAGLEAAPAEPAENGGLVVGTRVDSGRLPDLEGRLLSVDQYRGMRMLLVYWSPDCVFCELLAPGLAELQADLRNDNVQLVLASLAGADSNRALAREHGLTCPIVLLTEDSALVQETFRDQGTPAAYLLDEHGKVAEPLAVGGDEILALARGVPGKRAKRTRLPGERPLESSRIERNGIKAGTLAPPFQLPDLRGGTVSLEHYRGQRVLLVFSDPHCGPCEELFPHLVRIHRHQRELGLALIMVTRGDVEENRLKTERFRIEFPVAIQERWKLSKEFGIFAMPVAFLIDENGIIMRNVAQGVAEIVALVPEEMAAVSM
jgi:peroxiredoxin